MKAPRPTLLSSLVDEIEAVASHQLERWNKQSVEIRCAEKFVANTGVGIANDGAIGVGALQERRVVTIFEVEGHNDGQPAGLQNTYDLAAVGLTLCLLDQIVDGSDIEHGTDRLVANRKALAQVMPHGHGSPTVTLALGPLVKTSQGSQGVVESDDSEASASQRNRIAAAAAGTFQQWSLELDPCSRQIPEQELDTTIQLVAIRGRIGVDVVILPLPGSPSALSLS